MNIKKKDALYKIKGTKFPKKLYEVWTDTEGECLVDIWILKEEKENHEREIGSPVMEFIWQQEYKLLGDVIDILKMHEFML